MHFTFLNKAKEVIDVIRKNHIHGWTSQNINPHLQLALEISKNNLLKDISFMLKKSSLQNPQEYIIEQKRLLKVLKTFYTLTLQIYFIHLKDFHMNYKKTKNLVSKIDQFKIRSTEKVLWSSFTKKQ